MKTKHLFMTLLALLGSITVNADVITFADANVKALCVANWDTNGDGELSEEEAAAVTDLGTVFKENTTITSFNELAYFIGLTSIGEDAFYECSGLTSVTIPNSVISIGSEAFFNCDALQKVIVPDIAAWCGVSFVVNNYGLFSNPLSIAGHLYSDETTEISNLVIPEGVTSINDYAFNQCRGLTTVTIPSSVISIGRSAFCLCTGLISVTIPNSVTSIDMEAFKWCSHLTSVIMSNSVTSIGYGTFYNCSGLTSITIPSSVISIDTQAFSECYGLTSITIPNSVTSIGNLAFANCSGLTSVVSEIKDPFALGSSAFAGISSDCVLTIPIGRRDAYIAAGWTTSVFKGGIVEAPLLFADANVKALCVANWDTNNDGELSAEEAVAVTDLGTVFKENTTITSFNELPYFTGLTSIGLYTFQGCTGLTSVTIPNSVTSIGNYAFQGCSGLTSIVSEIEEPFAFGDAAFESISDDCVLTIPSGTRNAYIASGWTEDIFKGGVVEAAAPSPNIVFADDNVKALCVANWDKNGDGELSEEEAAAVTDLGTVFKENTTITSFNELAYFIGLTGIGGGLFYNCSGLTSVTIPNSVTSIGSGAFGGCTGLTSITISNGVTSIGASAFSYCSSLTSITIPNGVTSIENDAFRGCDALQKVIVPDMAAWCGITFSSSAANPLSIAKHLYRDEFTEIIDLVIPEVVTSISKYAFQDCSGLISVTIPSSVTSIGKHAFRSCSGLTSVTISNNVTNIEYGAFSGCSGLTSITIPNSVTSIGDYAFNGCSGLISVIIPNSLTNTGNSTFRGCTGLTSVTIPNSLTTFGEYAFYECSGLTSVTIPSSVISIGKYAFCKCSGLTSVVSEIEEPFAFGNYAFSRLSNNCVLTVPSGTRDDYIAAGWTENVFKGGIVEAAAPSPNIAFADANVKALCVANWDTNGDGELSEEEAAAVTDLGAVFKSNTTITSFNELQYFTGLTTTGEWTFLSCNNLTSVILPEGLTEIARSAFRGSGLESITFPTTLTEVGLEAFWGAPLRSVDFNGSAVTIDGGAFLGTALETLTIPSNVTLRGWSNFYGCSSLQTVTIESVEYSTIVDMFYGCTSLRTAVLPSTKIMSGAFFGGCTSLESVTFLSVDDNFAPGAQNYARIFRDLPPTQVVFNVPEGTAESLLQGGYMYLSDLSGLPFVRSEFEAEATRIQAMADALTDGDKTALATAISEARTAVNAAEDYATVYAQIAAIKDAAKIYLTTARLTAGFDVTAAFVTNPNFDRFQIGWNVCGGDDHRGWQGKDYNHYENGDVVVDNFIQAWRSGAVLDNGQFSQNITNLPAGTYRLECDAIATCGYDASVEVTGVNLFAGAETTALSTENKKPLHFSVEFAQTETGNCTIGIDINNTSANWVAMDNVRLYRLDVEEKNYLSMADAEGIVGGTVTMPVCMTNEDEITAFQVEIETPEGISVSSCSLTERKIDHTPPTPAQLNNGNYQIATLSPTSSPFSGNEGALLNVTLTLSSDLQVGDYPITIKNIELTTPSEVGFTPSNVTATLTVRLPGSGDVNGDGKVTITDAVGIVNYILGRPSANFRSEVADVNGDGRISITDAVAVVNRILTQGASSNVKEWIPDELQEIIPE